MISRHVAFVLCVPFVLTLACGSDGEGSRADPDDVDSGISPDGTDDPDAGRGEDAGQPPADAGADSGPMICERGEACCDDGTCSDGSRCTGEVCSCIRAMHGNHYVRSDGTVVHHTTGDVVELGDGGDPLDDMVSVYEGHFNACGLRGDGTVWCWNKAIGFPGLGQNGDGTLSDSGVRWQATPVLVDSETALTGAVALQTTDSRCYLASTYCAIRDDTTLWCWGEGANGGGGSIHTDGTVRKAYATQVMADEDDPLTGVEQVSLGRRHACAVVSGEMLCWGANVAGCLGQGDQAARQYPTVVILPGDPAPIVTQVGASSDVSCALTEAGAVYCQGSTSSGAVGLGDPAENHDGCINFCRLTPASVIDTSDTPIGDVDEIHLAYQATCAVLTDHTLLCWGSGVGNRATPLVVGEEPVTDVDLVTTCGTGSLPASLRYLTRDDELRTPSPAEQTCPPRD